MQDDAGTVTRLLAAGALTFIPLDPADAHPPNYRYYNNAFNDRVKQDSMNLFLGCYRPGCESNPLHLWDLESDYLLHNKILRPDIRCA